ncbi:MAG: RNA polymerase sigma factor [Hyphomonadaceae bacterium]
MAVPSNTENDLSAAAMRGDRRAFEGLVKLHQASVRAVARRLCGSASEGDDIAQAAFLTAWRRRESWRGGSFRGWVCTIAYREFLHARRKRSFELEADELADPVSDAPDQRMDILRAFSELEPNERAAAALCLGAGLSHAEAAIVMHAPLGTVKSWVARGRTKLQAALSAYATV